jgi:hypothetical protein
MGNMEQRTAAALFAGIDGGGAADGGGSVTLRYFELVGKRCVDLIAPSTAEPLALAIVEAPEAHGGQAMRVTGGLEAPVRDSHTRQPRDRFDGYA